METAKAPDVGSPVGRTRTSPDGPGVTGTYAVTPTPLKPAMKVRALNGSLPAATKLDELTDFSPTCRTAPSGVAATAPFFFGF